MSTPSNNDMRVDTYKACLRAGFLHQCVKTGCSGLRPGPFCNSEAS